MEGNDFHEVIVKDLEALARDEFLEAVQFPNITVPESTMPSGQINIVEVQEIETVNPMPIIMANAEMENSRTIESPRNQLPILDNDLSSNSPRVTFAQKESSQLVEKYFPRENTLLSADGIEVEDIDRVLTFFEMYEGSNICETNVYPNNMAVSGNENSSSSVLEKLIRHASKYDDNIRVRDFDLKSGGLKHRKKPRQEKIRPQVRECWGEEVSCDTADLTSPRNTCNKGCSANFKVEDEPETIHIDLRMTEEQLEEKRRQIQRVQSILGVTNDSDSD